MRLRNVSTGHPQGTEQIFPPSDQMPDVMKTILYRGEFFGAAFSAWLQAVLRGPSEWTVGERELFAAFTSRLNECRF